MITQVLVQCLNRHRQKVILKYVIDHVEDSARDPLVILELGDNAQSFIKILESIIIILETMGQSQVLVCGQV